MTRPSPAHSSEPKASLKAKDAIKVKEWLTPIVVGAYPDESVFTVTKRMQQYGIGAVIIYNTEQEALGIFTERDVLNKVIAEERDPKTTKVKEVMTAPIETVNISIQPMDIFKIFAERNFRHLPVALDDGRIIGVLSLRSKGFIQEVIRIMSILENVNEMKSRFLSNVSHELRTPLISMTRGASMALDHCDEINKLELTKFLKLVENQGGRLLTLIDDLLDMTALEAGKVRIRCKNVDIAGIIQTSIHHLDLLAKRKLITISFAQKADNATVYADESRISQVMENLLSNAIKFTPENGKIVITVENDEAHKNNLRIAVSDTGRGIPREKLSLIFERFEQAHDPTVGKPEGTGLGLAIVKEIVSLHNGKVWVESEEHQGATFYFTVPVPPAINF